MNGVKFSPTAKSASGNDLEIVVGGMRERALAVAVAKRVDVLAARAQVVADSDQPRASTATPALSSPRSSVFANLFDGDNRRVSDRKTAYALYIDPPLGRAGMTEAKARKSGRNVLVGTRSMTQVGRAGGMR